MVWIRLVSGHKFCLSCSASFVPQKVDAHALPCQQLFGLQIRILPFNMISLAILITLKSHKISNYNSSGSKFAFALLGASGSLNLQVRTTMCGRAWQKQEYARAHTHIHSHDQALAFFFFSRLQHPKQIYREKEITGFNFTPWDSGAIYIYTYYSVHISRTCMEFETVLK